MADVAIRKSGVSAVPNDYLIPGAQEIVLRSVSAVMDGSGAGVAWFPCLEIVDPSGNVLVSAVPNTSVAAGASADVSWFPGVTPAAAASGGGIQFDTDNVGGWLQVEETSTVGGAFSQPNAGANMETAFSQAFNANAGTLFTDDKGNFFNNGNPVVQIQHQESSGQNGGEGLVIEVIDTSAAPGDVSCIGQQIQAESKSTVSPAEGLIVTGQIDATGTADAFGIETSAVNAGSGRAIAIQVDSEPTGGGERIGILCTGSNGMHHYLKLPTSAGPTGTLWNNGGIVQVA